MHSIELQYKPDAFSKPITAHVHWSHKPHDQRPIALAYHGGGLMVGSAAIIPKTQLAHLCTQGFVVVAPNYRLAPQVSGTTAFTDCEDAFDWATKTLPTLLQDQHGVSNIDPARVSVFGHSSGGTLALHIASRKPIKAATAFYPSLFLTEDSNPIRQPTTAPPFGLMPDFVPTEADWAAISPAGLQISEAPMGKPGTPLAPRTKWQMNAIKHGQWATTVQPDGNYEVLDPLTRITAHWPPVMIVQGDADTAPGSSVALAQRAEAQMKAAGVREVRLEVVPGEAHMFDIAPTVGTSDLGPKWQAVLTGMNWLTAVNKLEILGRTAAASAVSLDDIQPVQKTEM